MYGGLNITQLESVPTLGAMLGSRGNQELLNTINRTLGGNSFFGSSTDRYSEAHSNFISKFVTPIIEANNRICDLSNQIIHMDYFRPLETSDDLSNCPPCMIPSILTYEPVYNLLRQGRIVGWGYEPESLVDAKEQYDRLVDKNGVVYYGIDTPEEDGTYLETTEHLIGIDPPLSFEDIDAIERTREYIRKLIRDTEMDPTSPTDLRG